jgi:paraquat-inducible protein B
MIDLQQVEEKAAPTKIQVNRSFSIVWIVPMVALLIGCWLAFKAISEKGPTITITFINAEVLEAGKTKIKYRDVDVGQVDQITLSKDNSHVIITAKMVKEFAHYLTDKTKFWVVRAQVRGGSVSGLSTLLSGGYIGVDPSSEGTSTEKFKGLEVPPVVTMGQPGHHFILKAETLGSLNIGTPVYYRQIQVGQVVSYNFNQDGNSLDIKVFVEAPYHKQVTENTRFWNASGIDFTLNAQGLKVETQSIVSIIGGGVAFDMPKNTPTGAEAEENATFQLYADRNAIQEKKYTIRNYYMLIFDESVRGLSIGAPVELYGIKLGEVVDLNLEFDLDKKKFQVPVIVATEPERVSATQGKALPTIAKEPDAYLKNLIEQQGLRAQLQSANLLTGQLMVNLVFMPDAPKATLSNRKGYKVLPTIPGSFEQLQERLLKVIANLEKIQFDQIGSKLQLMMEEARNTLKQIGELTSQVNKETVPKLQETITELQKTLAELQRTIGKDSPLNYNTSKAMEELTQTLYAIRELVDTLDRQPQSLIFGKEKESHE